MTTLNFAVRHRMPVLVGPARPTPRETKRLSDIDDQDLLRFHVPFVFFYRAGGVHANDDRDPASVIRRAIGDALVPYYPLAGRLREVEGRKLVVDCTGEGVLFVEADADVRLPELEEAAGLMRAPYPRLDQLLLHVEGSGGVLNCPLLHIQVTRLLCGGFVVALRVNHTICDGAGIVQFMSAVGELARGHPALTVDPVWSRNLLEARRPPTPTFPHREYDVVPVPPPPPGEMVMRTFRRAEISSMKTGLPTRLRSAATSFEVLVAAVWRARTAALEVPSDVEAGLAVVVNIRSLLPAGYYGNAVVFPVALTTAGTLLAGSLGDAVALVREAMAAVTAEYVQSTLDALVVRGRPRVTLANNTFVVSDNRHVGYHRVDLGWGKPVYGGLADDCTFFGANPLFKSCDGVGLVMVLPRPTMYRFALEVQMLLNGYKRYSLM